MKKSIWCILGAFFLLSNITFAADKPVVVHNVEQGKKILVKTAKMHARGKVIEISETSVKIERTVRGNVEIMEFTLDEPAENISVNDFIKVAYTVNGDQLVASKISKVKAKK